MSAIDLRSIVAGGLHKLGQHTKYGSATQTHNNNIDSTKFPKSSLSSSSREGPPSCVSSSIGSSSRIIESSHVGSRPIKIAPLSLATLSSRHSATNYQQIDTNMISVHPEISSHKSRPFDRDKIKRHHAKSSASKSSKHRDKSEILVGSHKTKHKVSKHHKDKGHQVFDIEIPGSEKLSSKELHSLKLAAVKSKLRKEHDELNKLVGKPVTFASSSTISKPTVSTVSEVSQSMQTTISTSIATFSERNAKVLVDGNTSSLQLLPSHMPLSSTVSLAINRTAKVTTISTCGTTSSTQVFRSKDFGNRSGNSLRGQHVFQSVPVQTLPKPSNKTNDAMQYSFSSSQSSKPVTSFDKIFNALPGTQSNVTCSSSINVSSINALLKLKESLTSVAQQSLLTASHVTPSQTTFKPSSDPQAILGLNTRGSSVGPLGFGNLTAITEESTLLTTASERTDVTISKEDYTLDRQISLLNTPTSIPSNQTILNTATIANESPSASILTTPVITTPISKYFVNNSGKSGLYFGMGSAQDVTSLTPFLNAASLEENTPVITSSQSQPVDASQPSTETGTQTSPPFVFNLQQGLEFLKERSQLGQPLDSRALQLLNKLLEQNVKSISSVVNQGMCEEATLSVL